MSQARRVSLSQVVIGEDEIAEVVAILRSGNLREGPVCRAFEEDFAAATGAESAIAVSSGTAALQIAYAALLAPGDEVLVPAFTFFATASMVAAVGAVPIFCDIHPETLTIDVADAARRITPRTRAIAPVHLFGNPADVAAVRALAEEGSLKVVWDAAQAHAATYDGRDIGSLGDVVCYSFYPSKNMTTGEGGMICTNDAALVGQMKLLRSQGQPRKYVHTMLGYNFRLTDFQAAIGRGQLRHLGEWTARRRENAAYLRSRLAGAPGVTLQREEPGGEHVYHQFSLKLDDPTMRDEVLARLRAAGVDCAVHYPTPLHRQPFFAASAETVELPVSESVSKRIFSIPVHSGLSRDDLDYVGYAVLASLPEGART
jgi:perosamine synthetase